MAYQFDFQPVLQQGDLLLKGALFTLELTAIGAVLGIALGILGAVCRAWRLRPFDRVFGVYVGLIRNTPFLIQLFFIFFGLPSLGVHISEWQAAVLAMVINLGAYSTEIIRAGIQAVPKGQLEAAAALAMTRAETFRHVILRPALAKVWPALSSQVVIVMLGSAVCSQISTEELTFAANFIQSRNFRAFETYLLTTLLYLVMAIGVRQLLHWIPLPFIQGGPLWTVPSWTSPATWAPGCTGPSSSRWRPLPAAVWPDCWCSGRACRRCRRHGCWPSCTSSCSRARPC